MSILSQYAWTPTLGYPTTHPSTLKSIATTCAPKLLASLSKAVASLETGTSVKTGALSKVIRGAQASLSIVSAEEVLATATDSSTQALATEVIYEAMYNLQELADSSNIFGFNLNPAANGIFLGLYILLCGFFVAMIFRSRYYWFNITFLIGCFLEVLGFLGRVMAVSNNSSVGLYALQNFCLTVAPVFIMAAIYFLFAQNIVIYGSQYSIMPPMWYTRFFVTCDVLALLAQGGGGGLESMNRGDLMSKLGKWIMVGGICFQLVAMTIFIIMWLHFVVKINFQNRKEVNVLSPFTHKSLGSFFKLFFDTYDARVYKRDQLERFYNPKFAHLRNRRLARLYPMAVTLSVTLIYIRCVYRVVELYQGYSGYLIRHEAYVMTLDALMIVASCIIFVVFHPAFAFGRENELTAKYIKSLRKGKKSKGGVEDFLESDGEKHGTNGFVNPNDPFRQTTIAV